MKRMKKNMIIVGSVLAGLFLILLLLPLAFNAKMNVVVKQEANKRLNAVFDYQSLHLSLLRNFPNATVELNNVSVKGTALFANDTLVAARSIRIVVNLMSLFGNKGYEVSRLTLDHPVINAIIALNGQDNWHIMKPDSTLQDKTPSKFHIRLKKMSVESANVVYSDRQANQKLIMDDFSGILSGDFTADVSNFVTKCNVLHLYFSRGNTMYLKNATAELHATVSGNMNKEVYTLKENELKVNEVTLRFEGWVAMLKDGYSMDLKLATPTLPFKSLLSLVPAIYASNFKTVQADGNVSMSGFVKGTYNDQSFPSFKFNLSVANGWFKYPELPQVVKYISLQLIAQNLGNNLSQATVSIPQFHLLMDNNPFDFSGFFSDLQGNTNFKVSASGHLDLGNINKFFPLEAGTSLSGTIDANLAASGTMAAVQKNNYSNIQATGKIQVNQINYQSKTMPLLLIQQGMLTFTQNSANLTGLSLKLGRSDLVANGKVENILPYVMSGKAIQGSLTLSSSYLNLNELMAQSSSPNKTKSSTAFVVSKNVDFVLNSSMKEVLFNTFDLHNVVGQVTMQNGILSMNNLKCDFLGGHVTTNGNYNTAQNPNAPAVDFSLNVQDATFLNTYQSLEMAKKFAPLFSHVQGNYNLTMSMKTLLDHQMNVDYKTFNAQGVLQSHNLSISGVPALNALSSALKTQELKTMNIKDVRIPFSISNGLVRTPPFDIKVAGYALTLGGTTGLDQSIQYEGKVSLPTNMPSPLGVHINNLPFQLFGTFSQPKVKLDMNALGKEVMNSAVNKVLNAVDPQAVGSAQADMQQRINQIRSDAKIKSDAILQTAQTRADQIVSQAKNPFTKIAVQKVADEIMKTARKQAADVLLKAEEEARKTNAK
jgi:hypothetical protein